MASAIVELRRSYKIEALLYAKYGPVSFGGLAGEKGKISQI
jgi:hypothetical protein